LSGGASVLFISKACFRLAYGVIFCDCCLLDLFLWLSGLGSFNASELNAQPAGLAASGQFIFDYTIDKDEV
jgi:hypothetical protein